MLRTKRATILILVVGLAATTPLVPAQEAPQSERKAMYERYLEFPSYVKGGRIEPHWMADGSSFWYAEGAPANTVIWKVDPNKNTKIPLFDTAWLREALTPLLGHEPPYQGLPFEEFTFVDRSETEPSCAGERSQPESRVREIRTHSSVSESVETEHGEGH